MSNAVPLMPSSLNPPNGGSILASINNTFAWTFNDPGDTQSAYYIEYAENVSGAAVNNTGWVTSPNSQHVFISGTFIVGHSYKWRVQTKDSINQVSPFSEWVVFAAAASPTAAITYPASDFNQVSALPTYQHTLSNPQKSYQYTLYDPTLWPDIEALTWAQIEAMTWDQLESFHDSILWDTLSIIGTGTSISQPPGYLTQNKTYRVNLQAQDIYSLTASAKRFFYVNMIIPPTPGVTATTNSANSSVTLTISNPAPLPGQAAIATNKIYRQQSDGSWVLEASNITGGTYTANVFVSGQSVTYAASGVAADGTESGKSVPVTVIVTFDDYWLVDPDTGASFKLSAGVAWGRMQSEREREEIWGSDSQYPSVTYGQIRYYRGSFHAAITNDDGSVPRIKANELRSLIDSIIKKSMWFKSPFGDVFKVDISNFKASPTLPGDRYRVVGFDMLETDLSGLSYTVGTYDTPPATLTTFWVIDPSTGTGLEFEAAPGWSGLFSGRDRSETRGIGGKYPSVTYGSKRAIRSSFSGYLITSSDMPTALNKVRNLLDAPTKKPLLFKSPFGDELLVDTYNFSFELMEGRLGLARNISFDFVEVGVVI